jgi:hypothetical protein
MLWSSVPSLVNTLLRDQVITHRSWYHDLVPYKLGMCSRRLRLAFERSLRL